MQADWEAILQQDMKSESYCMLMEFLQEEYRQQTVYPPRNKLFRAFERTPYAQTRVVLLGQDPYHGEGQADGLSFSVENPAARFPPSLRNMFRELEDDLGIARADRDLTDWAAQGVLLLNTVLSVRAGSAGSHRGKGWEPFTDAVIAHLNRRAAPVVFVLWGADAQKKKALITNPQHPIVQSAHPSPLSAYRGFFGSRPYSRINALLGQSGGKEIAWGKKSG
jgi:uracil-DNA glycosylase